MKSLKKTLVLLVVFSMILSAVMPAFAATDVYGLDCEEEVTRLEALGVVSGYDDGTYGPENTITRAEMAVILCKMVGIDEVTAEENKVVPSKFSDVKVGEWYTGFVNVAAGKGLLSGFPDGTFRPSEQLTMNQVLTLCVNALGRGEYVAEMGAWPANYIAEATKLGLLDGVKTSDANRGNIAIIAWNTLEAPYVWDVTNTEYEGSINLGDSERSLLSIFFRDYINEENELKELELTIDEEDVVNDNQINLALRGDVAKIKWAKQPKKDLKTQSYQLKDEKDVVRVYVPATLCEDLADLDGEEVTLILGEDNIAVALIIDNDESAKNFLTAYDDDKEEITVGEETYDLSKDGYTVEVNGIEYSPEVQAAAAIVCGCGNETATVPAGTTGCDGGTGSDHTPYVPAVEAKAKVGYANLTEALVAILGPDPDVEDIEKKIEATLTLDEDDDVSEIELFASATFANTVEVIVTDVNEGNKKYEIETTGEDIKWDLEDEEDEDLEFPRVYVDGEKGDIRDIVAGNVLTIVMSNGESDIKYTEDIAKIFVSTKTVTGEATKVRKVNNAITLDGTVYHATAKDAVKMTTEELEDNDFKTFDSATILDNEEVTLFLNMFGEYVAASVAEDVSDYQFGLVTKVYTGTDVEEINGDEYEQKDIKVLLDNGEEVRFTVQVNDDDKDAPSIEDAMTGIVKGAFIMFVADADKVITVTEDEDELMLAEEYNDDDYVVKDATAATIEGKKITVGGKTYTYTTNTVIFNNHAVVTHEANDKENQEIVSKWDSILKASGTPNVDNFAMADNYTVNSDDNDGDTAKDEYARKAYVVAKGTSTKALYVVVDSTYVASDYELAIVDGKVEEVNDGEEWVIDLVGAENVEVDENGAVDLEDVRDWLVAYTTKNSKINLAEPLINLDSLADADSDDLIDTFVNLDDPTTLLTLAKREFDNDSSDEVFVSGINFAQLEVSEVYIDGDDFADITFSAGEDKTVVNEAYAFNATKGNYYTEASGVYTLDSTYSDTEKYYEKVYEKVVDGTWSNAETYYTYTPATNTYTVASVADQDALDAGTYYTTEDEYVEVDLRDIDAQLGTVTLNADDLVAYDLRDGEVKEFTLTNTDDAGFYAIVYTDGDASIVFILD